MKIRFHPEARAEAREARRWYASQSARVAHGFAVELDAAIEKIRANPFRWPAYDNDTRRFLLRRFPFQVIYEIADDGLIIWAVAHLHRRPGYWKSRSR